MLWLFLDVGWVCVGVFLVCEFLGCYLGLGCLIV